MDIKRKLADAVTKAEAFFEESPIATGVVAVSIILVVAVLLLRA